MYSKVATMPQLCQLTLPDYFGFVMIGSARELNANFFFLNLACNLEKEFKL